MIVLAPYMFVSSVPNTHLAELHGKSMTCNVSFSAVSTRMQTTSEAQWACMLVRGKEREERVGLTSQSFKNMVHPILQRLLSL